MSTTGRELVDAIRSPDRDVRGRAYETAIAATGDETLRATAQELIASEADDKYRKKYATAWKR